jgi:magnesium chelatase subunit I
MGQKGTVMSDTKTIHIMPYSAIVGQEQLKLALELTYVSPRIGGVLMSGERGTGKSTIVRAFSQMMYDNELPVNIPINATEDRVVGGWNVDALMKSEPVEQSGLLEEANGKILYIDEVNLLDDHIVNIILDVTSTGVLEIQRDGITKRLHLYFTLIGTMNPEEGGLRPQLLDRFSLMANVKTEPENRGKVLRNVLDFDEALELLAAKKSSPFINRMKKKDKKKQRQLLSAKSSLPPLDDDGILACCVEIASELDADGHRGERVLALTAQACAALKGDEKIEKHHIGNVAPLALQHRQKGIMERHQDLWGEGQQEIVERILA